MVTGAPLPTAVSGIVFDCDGLLADTEARWAIAEAAVYARHGLEYTPDEQAAHVGVAADVAARVMAARFGIPERAAAVEAELLAEATKALTERTDPMPGAPELVGRCRRRVPVAVASNSPRELLSLVLSAAGFEHLPAVAADQVGRPKPAPDVYLAALREIGADPATALAFEDSATGMAAARAAGLRVVGVPTLSGSLADADWVFDRLDDPALLAWADALTCTGGR